MTKLLTAAIACVVALPLTVGADEPKPADVPLKAKVVAKKDTYKLDLDGKSGDEFRKLLKDAEKAGKVPTAPNVDLVLELTNTSDQEIKFWTEGDAAEVQLELKGPEKGAVTVMAQKQFTTEFRTPKVITLAPGKTHAIPIVSLQHGFRGAAKASYWTEPGDYTLVVTYRTAVSPAPKGSKEAEKGFGIAVVVSEPVKLKIAAEK